MALISSSLFTKIVDRLAYQYKEIKSGIEHGIGTGTNGPYFDNITDTDDYEIEKLFLDASYNFDNSYNTTNIVSGRQAISSLFSSMVNLIAAHLNTHQYATYDEYLSGMDIKVSRDFAELYHIITGRTIDNEYIEDRETSL